ncbi:hypothetical protein LINPERHAP2_LOCUS41433 [Linum perenne]
MTYIFPLVLRWPPERMQCSSETQPAKFTHVVESLRQWALM